MKKKLLRLIAFSLFLTTMFSACKGEGDPKDVTENFFTALNKKDFATAKKYATKESQDFLTMLEGVTTMADSSGFKNEKLKVSNVKIDGDNATVEVAGSDNTHSLTVHLKKQNSAWKVAFDKNAITDMATDAAKNGGADMQNKIDNALDTAKQKINELQQQPDNIKGALDSLKN